jgi:Bacterial self-protective colicin-like immunity
MTTEYQELIQTFVDQTLSIQDFEARYLEAFKSQPEGMHPKLFAVLDQFFADVDAYSPNCLPGEETAFCISESSLRQRAIDALKQLDVVAQEAAVSVN